MPDEHDSGFKLIITDFGKFKEFVEIIRNMDEDKIKDLIHGLEKDSSDLLKAEEKDK